MIRDIENSTHSTLSSLPPGWYIHEVKIRVFNLANAGEDVACSELLTKLTVSADAEAERLVATSVAPRPVYTEAGGIFLDVTWAVLRPIQKPTSPVVPVASDRRESSDAAAAARESFVAAAKSVVTPPGMPTELNLD